MHPSRNEDDEARRLLLVRATAMRQKLAALPLKRRQDHEAEATAYVMALKEWERGTGPYPEPPGFLTGTNRARSAVTPQPLMAEAPKSLMKFDVQGDEQTFNKQVRATRKALGWTQRALAERAKVTVETIVRIENTPGRMPVGTQHALSKIQAAFNAARTKASAE